MELPATQKQVRFDALLEYNKNREIVRVPTHPNFVGTPSPDIDAAWTEIQGPVTVFVTPEEVGLFGEDDMWFDSEFGLYRAQLTVFHDIHCLNLIRKYTYPDDYPNLRDETSKVHIEHCIDSLRLSLMCTGDMTFIPIRWSDDHSQILPMAAANHTCRDYDALKMWARERDAISPELRNKNGIRLQQEGV